MGRISSRFPITHLTGKQNREIHLQLRSRVLAFRGRLLDIGLSKENKNAIKLSHHPDGWLQFSGGGIISGRGKPGFGYQSWPMAKPAAGPAFSVTFHSVANYQKAKRVIWSFQSGKTYLARGLMTAIS